MKDIIIDRTQKPTDITVWYDTDITIAGHKSEWYIVVNYTPGQLNSDYVIDPDYTVQPRENSMRMDKAALKIQKLVERDAKKWMPKTLAHQITN